VKRSDILWFSAFVALSSVACGPGAGDANVGAACTPSGTSRGSCPEGMDCVSSTFFGMTQSFCYPTSRPRCGGTTCCPGGMRCYYRGFGAIEERGLFCLAPQEAARLCAHPQNHFVCGTQFGMLEPVPYSNAVCPDPFSDGGALPPRDASIDVFVPPGGMDAGGRDASAPDVVRPPADASRPDAATDAGRDASRPDVTVPDATPPAPDASPDVTAPPTDASVCSVSEGSPDCDTLEACNAATFMASCDDGERLRYCEAAPGSPTATIRLRFCVGVDVCRACRAGECSPGFESVCGGR
jgi:hypothetical protein